MRVAFISSLNGGVGTYTVELVKELSNKVDIIDLFLFSSYKRIPLNKMPSNVNIVMKKTSPASLLISLFLYIIRLKKYDIIHCNYASLLPPIFLVKKLWKVPFIYTSHDAPAPELVKYPIKFSRLFEVLCLKQISKYSSQHITISYHSKSKLKEKYDVSPNKVIYHGIDLSKYVYDKKKRINMRQELGISEKTIVLLFVGILYTHKNAVRIVDIMPKILEVNKDVKLLIVGRGEEYYNILNRIEKLNLNSNVIIKKYVEDIVGVYCCSDIFVFPSVNEGFGLVFLEAMACGLPIVTSNVSAVPEIVNEAGIMCNPNNEEELLEALLLLIKDKTQFCKLKNKGLQRVKDFTWENAANQYYEIYKSLGGNYEKKDCNYN
jgi:glycosyltransferase involved in cell wall biosynthesis